VQDQEADRERLEDKKKPVDLRCLRMSTVRDCWPALLREYEQKRADAANKLAAKEARR